METDGRKRRGAATRARILAATRKLVAEHGLDLALELVAAEIGLTKQAILHHFPSKERLFVEIALGVVQAERDAAIAAVTGRTGADALEAFVRALVRLYFDDIEGFRVLYLRAQLLQQQGNLRWLSIEERRERMYPVTGAMYAAVAGALAAPPGLAPGLDARSIAVCAHVAAVGFATMYGATAASGDPMKRGFEDYLDAFLASWRPGLAG